MTELDQRRKDERRKQRQLSQRRSSYNANSNDSSDASQRHSNDLTLEAMLLELQHRYGVVSLIGDNRFGGPADQWELIAGDEYEDSGYIYTASSPLAAVVQAYRAVVNESGDKEEQR
jgi:hypothetical protein